MLVKREMELGILQTELTRSKNKVKEAAIGCIFIQSK